MNEIISSGNEVKEGVDADDGFIVVKKAVMVNFFPVNHFIGACDSVIG